MPTWMELVEEDEKRQKAEAARMAKAGTINYKEEAKKTRIQYSLPQYQGKSESNKTYQWEKDFLKNEKIKGVRSYNDKFTALTSRMGMTEGQASEFRKYMDWLEDSKEQKPKLTKTKKDDPETFKDERINQQQALNYARGTHLKTDVVDGILDNMQKTGEARGVYNQKRAAEIAEEKAKEQQKQAAAGQQKKEPNKFVNGLMKALEIIDRPGDAVRTGIKEKAEGRSFWEGAKDGITGEKNTSGTELNKLIGLDPANNEDQREISRLLNSGLMNSSAAGALINALTPEEAKEYAANEMPGVATEVALDPLNLIGGATVKGARSGADVLGRFARVDGDLPTFTGQASDNVIDSLAPARQGNYAQSSDGLYEQLMNQKATYPDQETLFNQLLGDYTPPKPSPEGVTRKGINIKNWQDVAYGGNNAPPSVHDFTTNEIPKVEVPSALDEVAPSERDFINQELAPFNEAAQAQTQARQTWETVVKGAQADARRIKDYYGKIVPDGNSKDMINEIPPQFRAAKSGKGNDIYSFAEEEGFSSADEAIAYLKQIDLDSKMKLKDLTPEDNYVLSADEWDGLEQVARQKYGERYGVNDNSMSGVDDILRLLGQEENPEIVNNSQAPEQVLESLIRSEPASDAQGISNMFNQMGSGFKQAADIERAKLLQENGFLEYKNPAASKLFKEQNPGFREEVQPDGSSRFYPEDATPSDTIDNLLMNLDGTMNRPKPATESVSPAPASEAIAPGAEPFQPLIRLDAQQHAPGGTEPKLINTDGPMPSEKPIRVNDNIFSTAGKGDKFYQNYVNSNHSAKVAEVKTLENAIKQAKADGKVKKAAQLEKQLNNVKRYGSDLEKAVGNEHAAAAAAENFLKRHFDDLQKTIFTDKKTADKDFADALTHQLALDLNWRRNNGNPDYELPDGVDWGDINGIINRGRNNPKLAQFDAAMRDFTQEWRDVMLEYNLISKEAHAALSVNPHYMPLGRELSHKMSNVDRGTNFRTTSDKRTSGPYIVQKMGKGDVDSFFKNPIQSLIDNTFSVYKNAYKEETGRQFLRIAEMDKDGLFAQEISAKQFEREGGIKVANGGNPRYVRVQDDLMDMMQEANAGLDMDKLAQVSSLFAALKTRSFEYQTAALLRDTATSMVTSQVNDPFRYAKEYLKSLKNGSKDAKKIGAFFSNAHNEQTAGLDPEKVLKEFQRQYGGSVKTFNPKSKESWKELAGVIGRYLDTPFKYTSKLLGQVSDEIPRDIEVRETERLFMKQHGKKIENIQNRLAEVDEKLRTAENVTDPFDPVLQGVDKLKNQKAKLEGMLEGFHRDLRREQIYRGRDVINYNRGGRSKSAKRIRKWVVFANTTTQSKDKMIRSFIERPGATIAKATMAMAPLVAAQKLMFDQLSTEDKDVYDRVPNYIKMNNFVYVNNGNVYTVPKVQELALITNPIEAALAGESFNDVAKHSAKELTPYQLGNFTTGLIPDEEGKTLFDADPMKKSIPGITIPTTIASPFVDVIANDKLSFSRKPISYSADEASKYTPEVYKKLVGDNVNADRADYLVRQLLGDYGKYSTFAANALADPGNGDKIDELIRNINPLQDRIYRNNSKWFKEPILDKKK